MYSEALKKKLNESLIELVKDMLKNSTPFSLIVSNKNWSNPLPDHVAKQEYFFIQIQEQTLEDCYVDEVTNELIMNVEFNNIPNSTVLYPENIRGLFDITMAVPILNKPYAEAVRLINTEKVIKLGTNPYAKFKDDELTTPVRTSIDAMIKNNPNLFVAE